MNPVLMSVLSIAGFFLSLIAIFITIRKDAQTLRLEEIPHKNWVTVLGINNDSACDAEILSVGYFFSEGDVVWIDRVGDYATNRLIDFPTVINARSMRPFTLISGRDIPPRNQEFGYCVQLSTGRVYVLCKNLSIKTAFAMHFGSVLSRITRGAYVIPRMQRPRIPLRSY